MRAIIISVLVLGLLGCGGNSSEGVSGRCYVETGYWLAGFDGSLPDSELKKWPHSGRVKDAFEHFNTNDDIEYYQTDILNPKVIQSWSDHGYRMAIAYPHGDSHHARPYFGEDVSHLDIQVVYVAGDFRRI